MSSYLTLGLLSFVLEDSDSAMRYCLAAINHYYSSGQLLKMQKVVHLLFPFSTQSLSCLDKYVSAETLECANAFTCLCDLYDLTPPTSVELLYSSSERDGGKVGSYKNWLEQRRTKEAATEAVLARSMDSLLSDGVVEKFSLVAKRKAILQQMSRLGERSSIHESTGKESSVHQDSREHTPTTTMASLKEELSVCDEQIRQLQVSSDEEASLVGVNLHFPSPGRSAILIFVLCCEYGLHPLARQMLAWISAHSTLLPSSEEQLLAAARDRFGRVL